MKVAIMQSYIFPYIGYFQLINAVDIFVIYDNIQYTKRGWINRNRILCDGKDEYFTLTIKKDSDYLNVLARSLSPEWNKDKEKLVNKIRNSYKKASYYKETIELVENVFSYSDTNLFRFISNALKETLEILSIKTKIVISSTLEIDHALKGKEKVTAICKELNAQTYINPIGGIELYNKEDFTENSINLQFLKTSDIKYKQFNNEFIPFLSIIDILMFNSKEEVQQMLTNYELL